MKDFVIPARGSRAADIVISYDAEMDWLVIDGVKMSPELLVVVITNPDPSVMISFERKGDAVTCRQEMVEGVR